MRPRNSVLAFFTFGVLSISNLLLVGCGKSASTSDVPSSASPTLANYSGPLQTSTAVPLTITGSEVNVVPVDVGSSGGCGFNMPCVSVVVCRPGTTTCVTIPHVLLDTGSYGLRVFGQFVSGLGLTTIAPSSGGEQAECVQYGDGTFDWGSIATATVRIGTNSSAPAAASIPIQLVDANYSTPPAGCGTATTRNDCTLTLVSGGCVSSLGYNGILGVGMHGLDGGSYFSCVPSGTCTYISAPTSEVTNPVYAMSAPYNTGVILQFPDVSTQGQAQVSGWLVFGIDSTISPSSGTVTFAGDANAKFQTFFNGSTSTTSFIDSGSTWLGVPSTTLVAKCSNSYGQQYYCPSSTTNLSAVQIGSSGSPAEQIDFQVLNPYTAFVSSVNVAKNVASVSPIAGAFDWGFPFFLGKTVYQGFSGRSSTLNGGGTHPYWSY